MGRAEPRTRSILTCRQRECLNWVAEGKSSADIGAILRLSRVTVDEYIASACDRLGVRTRVQAAMVARDAGLLGFEMADDFPGGALGARAMRRGGPLLASRA